MLFLTALLAGCSTVQPTQAPEEPAAPAERAAPPVAPAAIPAPSLGILRPERVLRNYDPDAPTNLVQTADGDILVAEQAGRVLVFNEEHLTAGHIFSTHIPYPLAITDQVNNRGSEEGLLGMTVDPVNERHVYLYYSAASPRRSVVSRFTYSISSGEFYPGTELVILEVGQPYANHNGGQIAFGPDGYLYIGLGDGGAAGDPQGNGQNTSTLLGSILRIDVSESTEAQPYTIPPGNPFANGGGRPEIWAYGLRNPWRFSFDRETGELWTGDVGQNEWEEIDIVERGGNYGWNILEGNHCFHPRDNCDREGAIPPVWEYSLDGTPCSVIGGYVYRGDAIPWLRGAYVYGDFCSGKVYGLRHENGPVTEHKELADTGVRIMSFAEDNNGDLYLLSQSEGLYRLVAGR